VQRSSSSAFGAASCSPSSLSLSRSPTKTRSTGLSVSRSTRAESDESTSLLVSTVPSSPPSRSKRSASRSQTEASKNMEATTIWWDSKCRIWCGAASSTKLNSKESCSPSRRLVSNEVEPACTDIVSPLCALTSSGAPILHANSSSTLPSWPQRAQKPRGARARRGGVLTSRPPPSVRVPPGSFLVAPESETSEASHVKTPPEFPRSSRKIKVILNADHCWLLGSLAASLKASLAFL